MDAVARVFAALKFTIAALKFTKKGNAFATYKLWTAIRCYMLYFLRRIGAKKTDRIGRCRLGYGM